MRHIARSARGALNRYRSLSPYLKSGDRILDAGAGGGEVVYVLRSFGFDASGLEPDRTVRAPCARGPCRARRDGVHSGRDVSCRQFDVVTMYHALEHVEDPVAILSRLRGWMSERRAADRSAERRGACIAPTHRFHFAHFYNFNRDDARGARPESGFEPIETTTSADGGNLIGVFRAVEHARPPRPDPGITLVWLRVVKAYAR